MLVGFDFHDVADSNDCKVTDGATALEDDCSVLIGGNFGMTDKETFFWAHIGVGYQFCCGKANFAIL